MSKLSFYSNSLGFTFIPGGFPCPHIFAERVHAAVRVQRADRCGECQVNAGRTSALKAPKEHERRELLERQCVSVSTQTDATVLHVSVFIQRGIPSSLFKWSMRDEPQLETSHQLAVADVRRFPPKPLLCGWAVIWPLTRVSCRCLPSQVASGCDVGGPAGLCVALAPGGSRPPEGPPLRRCRGVVCPVRGAGALGRAPLGPGSGSHVCQAEGGRRELSDGC